MSYSLVAGVFGAEPLVQFPRSRLNLTEDDALTAVTVFLNSPTLSASEETFVHTLGLVSSKSGNTLWGGTTNI